MRSPNATGEPSTVDDSPVIAQAAERTRTADPFITSEVLYQLSYGGAAAKISAPSASMPPRRIGTFRLMGILAWIVLGFVSGLLARAIVPGGRGMGCLMTTAVGVLGALIGGAIASAAGVGELESFFDLGTWAIAVLGAVLLLLVLGAIGGRSRR